MVWHGAKFSARKVDGVWEYGKGFSADDLKDNFERVRDEARSIRISNEAKASLSI